MWLAAFSGYGQQIERKLRGSRTGILKEKKWVAWEQEHQQHLSFWVGESHQKVSNTRKTATQSVCIMAAMCNPPAFFQIVLVWFKKKHKTFNNPRRPKRTGILNDRDRIWMRSPCQTKGNMPWGGKPGDSKQKKNAKRASQRKTLSILSAKYHVAQKTRIDELWP